AERTCEVCPALFWVRWEKPAGPNGIQPSSPSPNMPSGIATPTSPRRPRNTAKPIARMPPEALSTRAAIFGSTFEMTPSTHSASASTSRPKMMVGILEIHLLTHDLILTHDHIRKPVPIPDQVRDML